MAILAGLIACVMCFAFTACGTNSGDNGSANGTTSESTNDTDSTVAPEKNILVVMREASSGTREAFDKYVNLDAKDAIDTSELLSGTELVRLKVAANATAIGYISLASVDDSVKALKVEGVEPTVSNVRDGKYKIQRPFLLLTNKNVKLAAAAQDFFNYCMSKTAGTGILGKGGITTPDFDTRSDYTVPTEALSGKVSLKGSTSMKEMILKLVADYQTLCGDKVANVQFDFDFPGSSGGRTAAKNDTEGTVIGLASSAKPNEAYIETTLCLDAVAIIVNKSNDKIDDINAQILHDIYTGKIKKFSEIK